jgi:hypothetical protein
VEVAALSHYFSAGLQARKRHVRQIFLSVEQIAQLIEYTRSLAGIATCDVREELESHAARIRRMQQTVKVVASADGEQVSAPGSEQVSPSCEVAPVTPSPQQAEHAGIHPHREAPKRGSYGAVPKRDHVIDVDQLRFESERESVIIPFESLRESVPVDPEHRPSSRTRMNRFLLRAVLMQLRCEQQGEKNGKQRRALKNKERRIRQIFRLRDQVPIHRLVEVTPVYARGSKHNGIIAYRVDIDVPMSA